MQYNKTRASRQNYNVCVCVGVWGGMDGTQSLDLNLELVKHRINNQFIINNEPWGPITTQAGNVLSFLKINVIVYSILTTNYIIAFMVKIKWFTLSSELNYHE